MLSQDVAPRIYNSQISNLRPSARNSGTYCDIRVMVRNMASSSRAVPLALTCGVLMDYADLQQQAPVWLMTTEVEQ
jgi:hypothetical protein